MTAVLSPSPLSEKEGKLLSGKEYIDLCRKRDKTFKHYPKLVYQYGMYAFKNERLQIRIHNLKTNKPGTYKSLEVDSIDYIIILAPNDTLKQTRWLECMVQTKTEGIKKIFLYFEPFFFDHM